MSRPVKFVTLFLWLIAVIGMVGVIAMELFSRDRQTPAPDVVLGASNDTDDGLQIYPVVAPDFSFTDQLGRTVTTSSLKGHPWIADFFFTQCASACPILTSRLAAVQNQIPGEVQFVSFSVDPDHDNQAALLAYAKQYGADNSRWHFVTGPKQPLFAAIAAMKVAVIPASDGNPIAHDVHYLLMDSTGRLRGVYDSTDPPRIEQMVKDANALLAQESKP
ncbi:MAG TPA: SCO family protein [Tepidisphaeraceae bacterium]|nr:SCO family protein [Tepidisphaeraceae bacterium]